MKLAVYLSAVAFACLSPAFLSAEQPAAMDGTVTFSFMFDNGKEFSFVGREFREETTLVYSDDPVMLCNAPYIRRLEGYQHLGDKGKVGVSYRLEFDEYEFNRPIIQFAADAPITDENPMGIIGSQIVVDLRENSTPEDLKKWLPKGKPVQDGGDWVIDMSWDFEPAPQLEGDALALMRMNPDELPEPSAPKWIDPETGERTDIAITRARVHADLRVPASYPDPDTGELIPCP